MMKRSLIGAGTGGVGVAAFFHYSETGKAYKRSVDTVYQTAAAACDYRLYVFRRDWHEKQGQAFNADEALMSVHERCAKRMLKVCLGNGGLYTKLGQYISTLEHAIPVPYTRELKQLQDANPPSNWSAVSRLIAEEYGVASALDVFSEFDEEPLACASIAQVHKAVTKEGQTVAVKVQHPHLQSQQITDVRLLETLSDLLEWLWPDVGFYWIFPEFEETVKLELDLLQEAVNTHRCGQLVRGMDGGVRVPTVLWPLTTNRIMVMEFIDGFRVDDTRAMEAHGIDQKAVARRLLKAHTHLLLVCGLFSIDPHPGNILIEPSMDKRGDFRLVLLDHGMYRRLDPAFRRAYCELWCALATRDVIRGRGALAEFGLDDSLYDVMSFLLTNKTSTSSSRLGQGMSRREKKEIASGWKHRLSAQSINEFLESLPRDLLFTFRANNLIRSTNRALGGTTRDRYTSMAYAAAEGLEIAEALDSVCDGNFWDLPAEARQLPVLHQLRHPDSSLNLKVAVEVDEAHQHRFSFARWALYLNIWSKEVGLAVAEYFLSTDVEKTELAEKSRNRG